MGFALGPRSSQYSFLVFDKLDYQFLLGNLAHLTVLPDRSQSEGYQAAEEYPERNAVFVIIYTVVVNHRSHCEVVERQCHDICHNHCDAPKVVLVIVRRTLFDEEFRLCHYLRTGKTHKLDYIVETNQEGYGEDSKTQFSNEVQFIEHCLAEYFLRFANNLLYFYVRQEISVFIAGIEEIDPQLGGFGSYSIICLALMLTSLEVAEVDLDPSVKQHRKDKTTHHNHVYNTHQQQLVLIHSMPRQILILQHVLLRVIHYPEIYFINRSNTSQNIGLNNIAHIYTLFKHSMHNQHSSFATLRQSTSVEVRGSGLFAVEAIKPYQVLLSVHHSQTFCYSNIPQEFMEAISWIKDATFISSSTNIERQLDYKNQALMLYLIYLKCTMKNDFYQNWLGRPITALYFFSRKAIEQSEDYDLLIDYVAEHNYLNEVSSFLFQNLGQTTLTMIFAQQKVTYEDFKDKYVWSYHFLNNRSFGYTSEYTLIPIFDMINHSSTKNNATQILSDLSTPQEHTLKTLLSTEEPDLSYQSDNEQQKESIHIDLHQTTSKLAIHNVYYHMVSACSILPNQEILIHYGNRNNKFLLEGYGFVEQSNPYDSMNIYLSQDSEKIYFDSVRGQSCKRYKLKRNQFNLDLMIYLKKSYYGLYYQKQAKNAKVIWSKPKDKDFQRYFISKAIERFQRQAPRIHSYALGQKGSNELEMYEHEHYNIYNDHLQSFRLLLRGLTEGPSTMAKDDPLAKPSSNLQEYLRFLIHL